MLGSDFNPPYNIKADYGFLHVYALTMTLGIILSILACYIKVRKKELPTNPLLLSVVFIVPSSLLCASFFGKADFTNFAWSNFFSDFAFWAKSGGMSIHGGVLGGVIAGMVFFSVVSRRYHISLWVWMDAIIPNVLIGQIIGRWGNFFNHELLGLKATPGQLAWLPDFIKDNCWKWYNGPNSMPEPGTYHLPGTDQWVQLRQPIFLYESFANFLAWTFITFVLPKIGKWFGPKPWLKYPKQYHSTFTYSWKVAFNKKARLENQKTYSEIWNDVYYDRKVDQKLIDALPKGRFFSKNLQALHNPDRYWILKCGGEAGAYFFFWNLIRFGLETQREPQDLFLTNLPVIDLVFIGGISLIGLVIFIITQFYLPYHTRKVGWVYEKDY